MKLEQLRAVCLELPGAFADHPFGPETTVFKIQSPVARSSAPAKMFALLWENREGVTVNLKCEPALAEQLRAIHPEITPGYHMNKNHWNTVDCVGQLPEEIIKDLVEDSYDLVVATLPRAQREALGWQAVVQRGTVS